MLQNYILARLQGPTKRDLRSLKHMLRYVKGATRYKLFIGRGLADYLPTHNAVLSCSRRTTSHWIYIAALIQTGQETRLQGDLPVDGCVQLLGTRLSTPVELMLQSLCHPQRPNLWHYLLGWQKSLHLQQLIEELQTGMGTTAFSYTNNNKKCITLYTDSTSPTKLSIQTGSEQEITTYLTTMSLDSGPMTSWRGRDMKSDYS